MTAPILVTGGTGTLGGHVVPRLLAAGAPVRVLSRTAPGAAVPFEHVRADLTTGEGLAPAFAGVDTVLHLAGGQKGDDVATGQLAGAAARAGVRHLVLISVIGADRMPLGWFRMKLGAEQAVERSGVPWTVLRAAQFHDLVATMMEKMARLPVVPVPGGLRFEPVASDEVADRLVELAQGAPAGRVPDLAGPEVLDLRALAGTWLAATGRRRPTMHVRMPGRVGRAYRAGDNLAGAGAARGSGTWAAFVEGRSSKVSVR